MDVNDAKDKLNEGKEKVNAFMDDHDVKGKAQAGAKKVDDHMGKLPFRRLAEQKIPAGTRAKFPILDKLIPHANRIVCGLAAVLVIVIAANAIGGGGGKPNAASDFSYDLTADGKGIVIKGYTGKPGKVVVPAKIEGMPVVEIGDGAFDGRSFSLSFDSDTGTGRSTAQKNESAAITSMTIPNTVTKIGNDAFAHTAITSFTMPDSVTELGLFVFLNCDFLTELRLSDNIRILKNLGEPKSLKKVNLPKKLEMINTLALVGCGELSELVIPSGLKPLFVEAESYVLRSISTGTWSTRRETLEEGLISLQNDPDFVELIGQPRADASSIYHYRKLPNNRAFEGCGKLPIATRQKIQEWGYTGGF